jgi:transposase
MPGMAQRFIACDREQSFLMPPDVRGWLPEDHFAWFVLDAVAAMELEAFYVAYRVDGRSRPAFDPAMMVALILYAYARGVRSSQAIERACVEDVAYRVIAAQTKPDHATIARFVERHQAALAACSARSSACARGPGWSASTWSPSTAARCPGTPAARRMSTMSGWRTRSSRSTARSTPRRTSGSAIAAVTSCRPRWRPPTAVSSGSKRPSAAG